MDIATRQMTTKLFHPGTKVREADVGTPFKDDNLDIDALGMGEPPAPVSPEGGDSGDEGGEPSPYTTAGGVDVGDVVSRADNPEPPATDDKNKITIPSGGGNTIIVIGDGTQVKEEPSVDTPPPAPSSVGEAAGMALRRVNPSRGSWRPPVPGDDGKGNDGKKKGEKKESMRPLTRERRIVMGLREDGVPTPAPIAPAPTGTAVYDVGIVRGDNGAPTGGDPNAAGIKVKDDRKEVGAMDDPAKNPAVAATIQTAAPTLAASAPQVAGAEAPAGSGGKTEAYRLRAAELISGKRKL